jgi:serine acetyltransferase
MFADLGEDCVIQEGAIGGLKYKKDCKKTKIENRIVIGTGTLIDGNVEIRGQGQN